MGRQLLAPTFLRAVGAQATRRSTTSRCSVIETCTPRPLEEQELESNILTPSHANRLQSRGAKDGKGQERRKRSVALTPAALIATARSRMMQDIKQKVALSSIAASAGLTTAKAVVGAMSGSLALL